jgi:hypothetical protein
MRPRGVLAAWVALGLCACGASPGPAHIRGAAAMATTTTHSLTLRLVDHLSFGARVESISALLDGFPVFETRGDTSRGQTERLAIEPGTHTLTLVASLSEPCGLLAEPRASATVRTQTTFSIGQDAAALEADLYPRETTTDPLRSLAVRFTGSQMVLGIPADALRTPDGCKEDDALCALEARASRARSRGDPFAACFESMLDEARALRDTLEDSYGAVTREGMTTRDAENAQLRARYALSRLRSIPAEAEACRVNETRTVSTSAVERSVDQACPSLDVTANAELYHLPLPQR